MSSILGDVLRKVPSDSGKGMSPADYVSSRLVQKSISRLLQNLYQDENYDKYLKVLVRLINDVFGTEYPKLRPPKRPDRPRETFNAIFREVLKQKSEDDIDGLSRDRIRFLADIISDKLYTSIPKDYFQPPGASEPDRFELPVCIIGAGAAGLYAAMILDHFGIKYEILEASSRLGGRIFTKRLEEGGTGKHDYFDVGAMRFPRIPMMDRTFNLFERLGLKEDTELIPYYLQGQNNPRFFNNIHSPDFKISDEQEDYFRVSESKGGVVPDEAVKKGYKALLTAAYKPFKDEFERNGNRKGWEKLSKYDMYSTRAYLALQEKYSPEVIEWCENMNVTAGLFDQAFSESVIRSMEFDQEGIDWWCIEGGSRVFIDRMVQTVTQKPLTRKRVTSISVDNETKQYTTMKVQVQNEKNPRSYSHVLSTVPLSCLRCIHLADAALSFDQHVAIRSLGYDSSVKVGIKFKTHWWRKPRPNQPTVGYGLTDGLIGLCVYPSYGLDDATDSPGVMIASYTLSQDARRMGALSQGKGTKVEERLIDLVLYDLAKLHNVTYEELEEEMLDHYAHDWYRDENAMGAFALFGPGQFSNSYPSLLKPAGKGKLNFIGEAVSRQHGWVSGSLNSAWRGIDNMFNREGDEKSRAKLREDWGVVNDLSEATLNLSVLIGTRGPQDNED